MICLSCNYYVPIGRANLIAPRCNWRPTADQLAELRATLPAPVFSRLQILSTPVEVGECSQFVGVAP
jgi:hypothetical protein